MKHLNWMNYVSEEGDFQLPSYLYQIIMDLMKTTLDFGTLVSNDPVRLRAFKEQTKSTFKKRWLDIAQALEAFDMIVPCTCAHNKYCTICRGSRYLLNDALSPDEMREISVVVSGKDTTVANKLQKGLEKALREVQ